MRAQKQQQQQNNEKKVWKFFKTNLKSVDYFLIKFSNDGFLYMCIYYK